MNVILERTFRNKIFVDQKIGEFCDVTAYRISLIWAFLYFSSEQFQLFSHETFLLKQNKTKQTILSEFCIKSKWFYHETFQDIRFSVGIEVKNDPLNLPQVRSDEDF